jgi:NADPH:quinone reductase-like Zn-dependent oxidoreductase
MKAIVHEQYGRPDVLELREVDKPVIEDDQVLVRVHASSVNPVEWYGVTGFYPARMGGLRRPKITSVGADLAGRVEAVGRDVKQLRPGDEVFGTSVGAWAEYAAAGEDRLCPKPANVSFEEAAAVPIAALTALQGLRDKGRVQPGKKVLINGASGGVGSFAVQIAKTLGAEVTGVCSTRNVELVRALGADRVIDYTQEDFTQGGPRYDLILDNAGNHSLSALRRALAPAGRLIPNSGSAGLGTFITAFVSSPFLRQQGRPYLSVPKLKDLTFLKELIEDGKLTPAIDRTYPLSDAADAFRYLGSGHARGKVVITT